MSGKGDMVTFEKGGRQFGLRTVAVILDREAKRVLVHRAEVDDFWALPGGRIEMGESSREALIREMREEMEVEVEVERLLWISEEFFHFLDREWHGIAFYHLARLPQHSPLFDRESWTGMEEFVEDMFVPEHLRAEKKNLQLIFQWHNIEQLHDLNIYPRFLRDGLRSIPDSPQHIVRRGEQG